MKKGKFIVFEGMDGSGKTTLRETVTSHLIRSTDQNPLNVIATYEPWFSAYGNDARKAIREGYVQNKIISADTLLQLFILDRVEHMNYVNQLLQDGMTVLCDRYWHSTVIYQSWQIISSNPSNNRAFDINHPTVKRIWELNAHFPVPDITFIVDVPVETALQRIRVVRKADAQETEDFLAYARDGYLQMILQLPKFPYTILLNNTVPQDNSASAFKVAVAAIKELMETPNA